MTELAHIAEDNPLDLECYSVRDLLSLIGAVRDTKPRDGLRALEDALLDLMGRV